MSDCNKAIGEGKREIMILLWCHIMIIYLYGSKMKQGVPMRVWYMRLGDKSAYYGADGSRVDATREELTELEVPFVFCAAILA